MRLVLRHQFLLHTSEHSCGFLYVMFAVLSHENIPYVICLALCNEMCSSLLCIQCLSRGMCQKAGKFHEFLGLLGNMQCKCWKSHNTPTNSEEIRASCNENPESSRETCQNWNLVGNLVAMQEFLRSLSEIHRHPRKFVHQQGKSWTFPENDPHKVQRYFAIRECKLLDFPIKSIKLPLITQLPGKVSYISKALKPQLLHKSMLAKLWNAMVLHHYIQVFNRNSKNVDGTIQLLRLLT